MARKWLQTKVMRSIRRAERQRGATQRHLERKKQSLDVYVRLEQALLSIHGRVPKNARFCTDKLFDEVRDLEERCETLEDLIRSKNQELEALKCERLPQRAEGQ